MRESVGGLLLGHGKQGGGKEWDAVGIVSGRDEDEGEEDTGCFSKKY